MKIKNRAFGLRSVTECYRCNTETYVYALGADAVYDEEVGWLSGSLDEPDLYMLTEIEELPSVLLSVLRQAMGENGLVFLKSAETYQNHCVHCGAVQGDFYLQAEPGGAFFPETIEAALAIDVATLPLEEELEVEASYGVGGGNLILQARSD